MMAASDTTLRGFITTLVLALSVTAAGATQSRTVNLEQMTARAAAIFAGRCLDVHVESDPALGGDVTVATFRVQRAVKGSAGSTVTIRMPGTSGNAWAAGVPSFERGDEVVLFLYGESALGMRAPVGLGQGRFRVLVDKQGRRMAINDVGNRNLMRGVSADAQQRFAGVPGLSHEGNLNPDVLLDAVEGLLGARR